MKTIRLAKQTECPKCKRRYAIKIIYGGRGMLPISRECRFCDFKEAIASCQ